MHVKICKYVIKVTFSIFPLYFPQSFINKFIQNLSQIFTDVRNWSGGWCVVAGVWWVQRSRTVFWFLSSSLSEGGLQQIQKISIQALGLSSDDFVEEKMIHALQTNRPQS